jgi:hypothetical protein
MLQDVKECDPILDGALDVLSESVTRLGGRDLRGGFDFHSAELIALSNLVVAEEIRSLKRLFIETSELETIATSLEEICRAISNLE